MLSGESDDRAGKRRTEHSFVRKLVGQPFLGYVNPAVYNINCAPFLLFLTAQSSNQRPMINLSSDISDPHRFRVQQDGTNTERLKADEGFESLSHADLPDPARLIWGHSSCTPAGARRLFVLRRIGARIAVVPALQHPGRSEDV